MARTVKTIDGITRPYYMRYANDRRWLPDTPRFNEYPLPDEPLFSDCGKINEIYRPHIDGALSILLDPDLWEGNEYQKQTAIQLMYQLMIWLYECEDDDMPQLRQSPLDPCVLEQLINGVWVTAFDYGLCLKSSMPTIPQDEIAQNVAPIIEASQEAFNAIESNGLAVEYPNAENSPSDPQNAPKNAILCVAIREYITKLADYIQAMAISQNQPNEPNFGQLLVDWGTTIGTGVSLGISIVNPAFGAGFAWLNNMARVGAGASFLYSASRTTNTTQQFIGDLRNAYFDDGVNPVVIDDDTRNQLICQMYDSLKDKPLTQENFNEALGNFPEATTVEQALKNITNWLFLTNVAYGEFVMVYNQLYIAQQTGAEYTDNDCGCVDPELECGINYNWSTWDATPIDVTFFESYPITAPPVQVAYYPATPFVSHSPFVINTPKTIYQVYELPCNKGISAVWGRLNTNSASAYIETYDGTEWVIRATQTISVSTVSAFRLTISWANTEGIVYQGARVKVITPAPLIDTFRIGL